MIPGEPEELTWFLIGNPNFAPGNLPILKRLRTSLQVIIALDQLSQDHGIQVEKPGDPASLQRMTLSTPMPDPPVLRPLECLDVRSVDAQTLASFKTFDRMSLCRFGLHMLGICSPSTSSPNSSPTSLGFLCLPSTSPRMPSIQPM